MYIRDHLHMPIVVGVVALNIVGTCVLVALAVHTKPHVPQINKPIAMQTMPTTLE